MENRCLAAGLQIYIQIQCFSILLYTLVGMSMSYNNNLQKNTVTKENKVQWKIGVWLPDYRSISRSSAFLFCYTPLQGCQCHTTITCKKILLQKKTRFNGKSVFGCRTIYRYISRSSTFLFLGQIIIDYYYRFEILYRAFRFARFLKWDKLA